jgi:carboxypeptidase C (cathepsin A)
LLSHSVLTVIESAGHMAPMEQPESVAKVLSEWISTTTLLADFV